MTKKDKRRTGDLESDHAIPRRQKPVMDTMHLAYSDNGSGWDDSLHRLLPQVRKRLLQARADRKASLVRGPGNTTIRRSVEVVST